MPENLFHERPERLGVYFFGFFKEKKTISTPAGHCSSREKNIPEIILRKRFLSVESGKCFLLRENPSRI
jgi:hypothetical protein